MIAKQRRVDVVDALPALLALVLGSAAAYLERNRVLDPDVLGFQMLARDMTPLNVFGGLREPIWPALLVAPVDIFGDQSALPIRLFGVLGFVFMVIAFQWLTRKMYGRVVSVVLSSLLAVSPWLVYQASRGLREETSAALMLVMCAALIRPKISGRRFVLLFALAGVTGLLRWDVMVVMLPVLGIALLVYRPHPAAWVAGPMVAALLVAPLLLANYAQHGDPLYHSNMHARFFRNLEFRDQPGFVTSAEMAQYAFAGAPITWTQYVFGLHSPAELATRAVDSFKTIPINVTTLTIFYAFNRVSLPGPVTSAVNLLQAPVVLVIWVFSFAGAIGLLRTRAWPVPIFLGEIILVYSPIAGLIDFRLVLTTVPLLVICAYEAARLERWAPAFARARASFRAQYGGGTKAETKTPDVLDVPARSG